MPETPNVMGIFGIGNTMGIGFTGSGGKALIETDEFRERDGIKSNVDTSDPIEIEVEANDFSDGVLNN